MRKILFVAIAAAFAAGAALAAETCFLKGERTDGMNKICFYKCITGDAAITIRALELCPMTINR